MQLPQVEHASRPPNSSAPADAKLNWIIDELIKQRAVQANMIREIAQARAESTEKFDKIEQLIQAMTVEVLSGHLNVIQAMRG